MWPSRKSSVNCKKRIHLKVNLEEMPWHIYIVIVNCDIALLASVARQEGSEAMLHPVECE